MSLLNLKGDTCMVDETLILRKLSELDEYYKQITEYKKLTVAQYSGDWKVQRIIERTLQMIIETCVDAVSLFCFNQPGLLRPACRALIAPESEDGWCPAPRIQNLGNPKTISHACPVEF
jgi:hypothetical protein